MRNNDLNSDVIKKVSIVILFAIIVASLWENKRNYPKDENVGEMPEAEINTIEPKQKDCNYFFICNSLKEFRESYNKSLKELHSPLRINEFILHDKGDGVCFAFEYTFDEELFITGTLNSKDNSMRGLLLGWVFKDNATSYSSNQTSFNFLGSISAILSATNPSLSASDKGEVLRDLGMFDFKAEDLVEGEAWKGETIRNGISYSVGIAKGQVIIFAVEQPS